MKPTKTSAEVWRRVLQERLYSLHDVQYWANVQIALLEAPPHWLIAVSTARDAATAISSLGNVEGEADPLVVWSGLMKGWKELLSREPTFDYEIARKVHLLAKYGEVPVPGISSEMMSFLDALDLSPAGMDGSRERERGRLLAFLKRWGNCDVLPNTPLQRT